MKNKQASIMFHFQLNAEYYVSCICSFAKGTVDFQMVKNKQKYEYFFFRIINTYIIKNINILSYL